MGTTLHTLQPPAGARKRKKRIGRGIGSGRGKTATRGAKGQLARRGVPARFEGGQNPIHRRVPKRGFNNPDRVEVFGVNVGSLDEHFATGDVVTVEALHEKGLAPRKTTEIKLLGSGELTKKLTIKLPRCSEGAREKVVAAGGSVEDAAG